MTRASLSVLFLAALALAPVDRAGAQVADQPSVTPNTSQNDVLSTKQAGITRHALQQHARHVDTKTTATVVTQTRPRRGTALMIVGGAAFLAGLIIGDDAGTALAIGGAVVGLYGLYLWAQ